MLRNQNEIERRKRMTPGSKGRVVMAFGITSTRSFNDQHKKDEDPILFYKRNRKMVVGTKGRK